MKKQQTLNGVIRLNSIVIKGVFLIFSSIFLDANSFKILGLIVANSSFITILFGLEFYRFCQRESGANLNNRSNIYANQLLTYFSSYLIFALPIFLFGTYFFTPQISLLFLFICISDHLSQEFYRVLIFEELQLRGSLILFLRSSAWSLVVLFLYLLKFSISLELILVLWLSFSIMSIVIGFFILNKQLIFTSIKYSFKWILRGLKLNIIILISALSFRSLLTFDRNALEIFYPSNLAEYIFIGSFIGIFLVIADSVIFSFYFPRILKSDDFKEQKKLISSSMVQIVILGLTYFFVINVLYFGIKETNFKPEFFQNYGFLFYGSCSMLILSFSIVPNYLLYAKKKDFLIAKINILIILASLFLLYFIKDISVYSINIALIFASVLLFITKMYYAKKISS